MELKLFLLFLQGSAVLTSHSLCIHVKAWVKDLWWAWLPLTLQAKPLVLLPPAPSPWHTLWVHHWGTRNLYSSKAYDKDPAMPYGFTISVVRNGYECALGKASSVSYSHQKLSLGLCRCSVVKEQEAANTSPKKQIHSRAQEQAGSLIIYYCPKEHLQRHVLLSDLHVTCRITCSAVKTSITIITTWQTSKQKPGATKGLPPRLPTPKKAHT